MSLKKKSFMVVLITVFFVLMSFPPVFGPIDEVENPYVNENAINNPETSDLLKSSTAYSDWITISEQAAQWLFNEANTSDGGLKWDENGVAKYGLADGVASVGLLFIELYQKTNNNTYKDWANQIGIWYNLTHPSSYDAGKWPNKQYGSDIVNYTGIDYGSAGIGRFFLKLYEITLNSTYLDMAKDCAQFLTNIESIDNGLKWYEQDPINLSDFAISPNSYSIALGDNTTVFDNIEVYDKQNFTILAEETIPTTLYQTNVSYWFILGLSDLPEHTDYAPYISEINVSLTIVANITLPLSNVSIYNTYNDSWVAFDTVSAIENEVNFDVDVNVSHWLDFGNIIKIRVHSNSSANHTVSIDSMNATVDYYSQINSSSYSTGAAGIGDFFLDMYKATADLTYLDKAQKAASYLISNATVSGDTAKWYDKFEYYTTVPKGAAGIGNFFLRLSAINASNSDYIKYARMAANWLINNATSQRLFIGNTQKWTLRWGETDAGANVITGTDVCAGIAQFLIDFSARYYRKGFDYVENASRAVNWLKTNNIVNITGKEYSWRYSSGSSYFVTSLGDGAMGALLAINKWYLKSRDSDLGKFIAGGIEWIRNEIDPSVGFWNNSLPLIDYDVYNFKKGVAGIAYGILQLALSSYDALDPAEDGVIWMNFQGSTYNGLYEGRAGLGMANLEMYRAQDNDSYLAKAEEYAQYLLDGTNWQRDDSTAQNYTGLGYGIAGIGYFMIEMYLATGNSTYLDTANAAGDWLIVKAELAGAQQYYWRQIDDGSSNRYLGMEYGSAGIVYFLSKLYQITKNYTHKLFAEFGINYLKVKDFQLHDASGTKYNGWNSGIAGIGYAALELYKINRTSAVSSLVDTAFIRLDGQKKSGQPPGYYWTIHDGTSSYEYGKSDGSAGIIKFLVEYYKMNRTSSIKTLIDNAVKWLSRQTVSNNGIKNGLAGVMDALMDAYSISHDDITKLVGDDTFLDIIYKRKNTLISNQHSSGYWDAGKAGYEEGAAGIASVLVNLPDIDLPTVDNPEDNPIYFEYSSNHIVTFTCYDYGSGLKKVYINYSINAGNWSGAECSFASGITWQYQFTSLNYNDNVSYYLTAVDNNNLYSKNDNDGANFSIKIVDTTNPGLTVTVLDSTDEGDIERAIEYGSYGRIKAIVDEPAAASGVASVSLSYKKALANETYTTVTMSVIAGETNAYSYTFLTTNYNYGDVINYTVTATDVAGNTNTSREASFTIADYSQPHCIISQDFQYHPYSLIEQFTAVRLVANVTDGGAGLKSARGVWINYSIDNGINWQVINMTYDDALGKYVGYIPGQLLIGTQVMYCLCAEDNAGNTIAWDYYGDSYSSANEVPRGTMFRYSIGINWIVFLIVIVIVAGVSVIAVYAYATHGTYYERMRRKSKTTTTKLVVQERLASFYYWMIEKLENTGNRLGKAGASIKESFANIGTWGERHLGERTRKILGGIGRAIIGIPIAIYHGFIGFFKGLGKLITGARLYHIIIFIVCGLMMVLLSTIQFIMEGEFPLRAVFFVDLGLVMFIIGLVVIIIRSVYRLVYK